MFYLSKILPFLIIIVKMPQNDKTFSSIALQKSYFLNPIKFVKESLGKERNGINGINNSQENILLMLENQALKLLNLGCVSDLFYH